MPREGRLQVPACKGSLGLLSPIVQILLSCCCWEKKKKKSLRQKFNLTAAHRCAAADCCANHPQVSLLTHSIWLQIGAAWIAERVRTRLYYIRYVDLRISLWSLWRPAETQAAFSCRRRTLRPEHNTDEAGLLRWEATGQDRNKIPARRVMKDKNAATEWRRVYVVVSLSSLSEMKARGLASFELLSVVRGWGLTWSVEHHEDRPILPLQELPEILHGDWTVKNKTKLNYDIRSAKIQQQLDLRWCWKYESSHQEDGEYFHIRGGQARR